MSDAAIGMCVVCGEVVVLTAIERPFTITFDGQSTATLAAALKTVLDPEHAPAMRAAMSRWIPANGATAAASAIAELAQ